MLKGEKILIIGAGGLLGLSLVEQLIEKGASVIAADLQVASLEKKLSHVNMVASNASLNCIELNLLDELSVKTFFSENDNISGVVNCAYPRNSEYGSHFFDVSMSSFNENISMNLGSAFLLMQECAQYFKLHLKPLSIVNISSIYGVLPPKFDIYDNTPMTMPVEYAAIKSALIHLSKYVVKYVNDSRFRVNLVSPGGILDSQPDEFLDSYKRKTLGKGMLDVEDVIGSIIFLLSRSASYVNGQNIVVDDGFTL